MEEESSDQITAPLISKEEDRSGESSSSSSSSSSNEINGENSPIEQVALTVSTADDPSLPVLTFRMWFLGTLSCVFLSFLNQFFWYRTEPLSITAISAQIAVVPLGQLMAAKITDRSFFRGSRFEFTLNPGPFNMKEHVLITIFANSGACTVYAIHVVTAVKIFYKQHISFFVSLIVVITTQEVYIDVDEDIETFELHDFSEFFTISTAFDSKDALVEWAMNMAISHGHEIRRQSYHEGRQYLTCKRAYKSRGKNAEVKTSRKSGTIKCKCPFALWGKEGRDGLWRLTIKNGNHNHNPHKYPQGLRSLSRLTEEQREVTKILKKSHVKPKEILHHLRQMNPDTSASLRDMYNESQKIRREEMKGKTVIQHLWHELSESGYSKWHRTNPAGDTVQDVMFAHPDSIKLLQLFPYVILMDCTYKTNRYEMPLLEIIGVTPVGRNFTIAVAFMSREDGDTYAWTLRCLRDILPIGIEPEVILTDRELGLLKALSNVFPHSHHMLCLYHINRNVEANASKFLGNTKFGVLFRRTVWAKLVESETEEEYECNYREIVSLYGQYPKLITYINETWLIYKERFVKCWTNNIVHFGNTTTNRVESAHRASKRWIQTSTGAMDTVQNALDAQVDLQINELKVENESSKTVRMYSTSLSCFGALVCNVSHKALDLLDKEYERLEKNPDSCNCYLSRTHGLPCACMIAVKIAEGDTFYPQQLHPFWRTLVVEPKSDPWEDEEEPFDRTVAIKKVLLDEFEKLSNKDYMSQKNAADYLRDLNNPSSTHLQEPSFVKAKGRPKNNSMERNLSGYEHMMNRKSEVKSSSGSKGRKTPTERTPESKFKAGTPESKVKGRPRGHTKSTEESVVTAGDRVNFFSFLPPFLAQSIASYVNVRADGNCGYRCIAEVVYGSQERWPQVRTDLVEEFMERYNLYATIFGGDEGGRNTVADYILTCSHERGPAPRTKWMSTDMGLAIATRYNAMVLIFTERGSITYLPLVGNPALSRIIPMSLHNDHFMIIRVPVSCPLPRLHPQWRYFAAPNLLPLRDFYADRLAFWTTLTSRHR